MKYKENLIEEWAKENCEHFDEEVCSKLDCKKDCKYYGKANCYNCIHEDVCQLRAFSYCEEEVKEKGCEYYKPKLFENSVVLTREGYDILIAVENERIKEARKEMVEKILEKVDYESNGQTKQITDILRKKFGVKIKY